MLTMPLHRWRSDDATACPVTSATLPSPVSPGLCRSSTSRWRAGLPTEQRSPQRRSFLAVNPTRRFSSHSPRQYLKCCSVGATPASRGNVLRAYDASGNLLEEASVALAAPGGGHAAWIGFKRQAADIAWIVVQPDQSLPSGDDYVIDNIQYLVGEVAVRQWAARRRYKERRLVPAPTSDQACGSVALPLWTTARVLPGDGDLSQSGYCLTTRALPDDQ